jgi:hypothetical protein
MSQKRGKTVKAPHTKKQTKHPSLNIANWNVVRPGKKGNKPSEISPELIRMLKDTAADVCTLQGVNSLATIKEVTKETYEVYSDENDIGILLRSGLFVNTTVLSNAIGNCVILVTQHKETDEVFLLCSFLANKNSTLQQVYALLNYKHEDIHHEVERLFGKDHPYHVIVGGDSAQVMCVKGKPSKAHPLCDVLESHCLTDFQIPTNTASSHKSAVDAIFGAYGTSKSFFGLSKSTLSHKISPQMKSEKFAHNYQFCVIPLESHQVAKSANEKKKETTLHKEVKEEIHQKKIILTEKTTQEDDEAEVEVHQTKSGEYYQIFTNTRGEKFYIGGNDENVYLTRFAISSKPVRKIDTKLHDKYLSFDVKVSDVVVSNTEMSGDFILFNGIPRKITVGKTGKEFFIDEDGERKNLVDLPKKALDMVFSIKTEVNFKRSHEKKLPVEKKVVNEESGETMVHHDDFDGGDEPEKQDPSTQEVLISKEWRALFVGPKGGKYYHARPHVVGSTIRRKEYLKKDRNYQIRDKK